MAEEWIDWLEDEFARSSAYVQEDEWRLHCIYRVPKRVSDLNSAAYKPQTVSLGPFHHGDSYLQPMEEHKWRASRHLVRRSRMPPRHFVAALDRVGVDLQSAYMDLESAYKGIVHTTNTLLERMLIDGCFVLEVMRIATGRREFMDYSPNDPVFSVEAIFHTAPYVRRDMLILENQLPLLALKRIVAAEMPQCHPVGVELYAAGIRFRSKTKGLRDIGFLNGVLSLPKVTLDGPTEHIFLNMLAFERLHVGAGNDVAGFVFFLDRIIHSAKDVTLLRSKGIIQNLVGSDDAVARIINAISRDAVLEPGSLFAEVYAELHTYRRYGVRTKLNTWLASLVATYFRSPWTAISLVAAAVLLVLAFVQTVCTVVQFHRR